MALPGALPIPNPCPVFAGSDGEPSTASSSCTWKNTGPDRDCVSKSPTRTRRSAVSCSSDLGCLGSRQEGGPPARPVAPTSAAWGPGRRGARLPARPPSGALGLSASARPFSPASGLPAPGSARPCAAAPLRLPPRPRPVLLLSCSFLPSAATSHVSVSPAPPLATPAAVLSGRSSRGRVYFLTTGPSPSSPRPDLRSAP